MAYIVQNMTLIPQNLTMSCWYASLQMLIRWKEDQKKQSLAHLISPEHDTQCVKLRDSNGGIGNSVIVNMAKRIGLKTVPPVCMTADTLEGWLESYGPLWVNGTSHIVVIAGIMWMPGLGHQVLVYDPSPVGLGSIEWRSLSGWYEGGKVDSRDTGAGVETIFLYVPDDI
ncbi:MAG: hypothetical protein H7070_13235 [Saprospiraceae bacterium]|nr:hypothetical protein [Pyrinomonadaceae bacterium]